MKPKFGSKKRSHKPTGESVLPSSLNVDELISQALACQNNFDLHQAARLYNKALKQLKEVGSQAQTNSSNDVQCSDKSNYTEVLRSLAYVLIELGRSEEAKKHLLDLMALSENPGYETYMYLGQLSTGIESLTYYQRGIECIRNQAHCHSSSTSAETPTSLTRAESTALCAIAELYMTDLCDLAEAESECKKAFEGAIQVDPSNPQSWVARANFYTVTAQEQFARESINQCLELWWSKLETALSEAEAKDNPHGEDTNVEETLGDEGNPSTEDETQQLDLEEVTGIPTSGLISLSRMMLELDMNERAATLLEALLEEKEDNAEVHYLLTVVGRKIWKNDDPQLLRYYAMTTKTMASKLGDHELVDEMTELLNELPSESLTDGDNLEDIDSTDEDEDPMDATC